MLICFYIVAESIQGSTFKYPQEANNFLLWKRTNTLDFLSNNVEEHTLMLEMVI